MRGRNHNDSFCVDQKDVFEVIDLFTVHIYCMFHCIVHKMYMANLCIKMKMVELKKLWIIDILTHRMWTVSSPHWPTILLAVLLVFFHLRVTIFRIPVARYPNLVANRMNVGKLAVATFLSGFLISFPWDSFARAPSLHPRLCGTQDNCNWFRKYKQARTGSPSGYARLNYSKQEVILL